MSVVLWSIFTTKCELILTKIFDKSQRSAAPAARLRFKKILLGRGGKKKGCGENEFPPHPRFLGYE
jgi:hypothetical protein